MKIKNILGSIILIIIFYFLFLNLSQNWSELSANMGNLDIFLLIISLLFLLIFYLFHTFVWIQILKKQGYTVNFKEAFKIRSISEIGKYTPGKVWHIIGRTYLSSKLKIPKITTLTSMVIETLLMLISAGFFIVLFSLNSQDFKTILILILTILGLLAIRTKYFERVLNKLLKKTRKITNEIKINISLKFTLLLLVFYLFGWLIIGHSLFFIIKSIYPQIDYSLIFIISGIFAASWALGYISFLTPGGLGVREGIMVLLLYPYLPNALATIVPIIIRLLTILTELVLAAISSKIKLQKNNREELLLH
jgi:glycosyltransferase 2 family protein